MARLLTMAVLTAMMALLAPPSSLAADSPTPILNSGRAYATLFAAQPIPQGPEVDPLPGRTGLSALAHSTADDFKAFPRRTSTWVILGVGAAAALAVHPVDDTLNPRLQGSRAVSRFFEPGKWLGSAPIQLAASAGLYLIGRYVVPREGESRTNKWSHLGFDLVRAQAVSQAVIQGMKVAIRRDRPTGECCAFPSGHAASAFAAASVLERHFGYRGAWPTLLIATYVATSRLHDNRHFVSDVMMGSAIGVATGWTVVGRHGRSAYALIPVPVAGGVQLSVMRREADSPPPRSRR